MHECVDEEVDGVEGCRNLTDCRQERKGAAKGFFAMTPEGTSFSAGSFGDLHLSRPLLKACAALGYTQPTPIQARTMARITDSTTAAFDTAQII